MADGSTLLEIIISAVDEASEAFAEINDNLAGVSDAAAQMVDATTASFNEFMASVSEAAAATGLDENEIMSQMEATGLTAQEVADQVILANDEVQSSNDLTKGSFMPIGIAAGIAFGLVESAISSSISSAQGWDVESATIQGELNKIGSAIPLSQVQEYAQHIQATTLLTQQQALQSEGVVLAYKDLAPKYQELTSLGADLATRMSQTSGTLSENMPNAMQAIATAMEDPVAGLNKLIRAGAAFSSQQVEQIEHMANVGNTAGAQAEILKILQGSVGGLAEEAAKAPGGGLIQLQNAITSLGNYIGNDIIPTLDALAHKIEPIITEIENWVEVHPKLTEAIVAGTLAFTAFLAAAALIGIAVAAIGAPVALAFAVIGAAIAGLIAIIVPNWKACWDGFQDVANVGAEIIAGIVEGFIDIILAAWYILTTTMPEGLVAMWNIIGALETDAFNLMKNLFTSSLKDVGALWQDGLNALSTIATDVWNAIGGTFKTGIDGVISAINSFINALDAIHITLPSISIPGTKISTPALNLGFNIPDIPMLAEGGIVNTATLALIGESGPEAVIPLSSGAGGYGGGQNIIINITGGNYLDSQGANMIAQQLAKQVLRGLKVTNYAL